MRILPSCRVSRSLPEAALLVLLLGAPAAAVAQVIFDDGFEDAAQLDQRSSVGINLDEIKEFSLEYHFVDAFKQSRQWMTSVAGGGFSDTGQAQCLDLDEHGWVRRLTPLAGVADCAGWDAVQTTMFEGYSEYPSGEYLVLYEGQGTIEYGGSASLIESTPGRDRIQVNAANGLLLLRLIAIDTADPIREIRVLMPGFDSTGADAERFHPDFLRAIEGFRVLRFMDWQEINGEFFVPNPQQEFADRPLLADARWTGADGAPIELMMELANRTGADPWINIPHRADDDYVAQFAALALATLDPEREIYVEYSNEVWNGGFPQGGEIEAIGVAAMGGQPGSGFTKRMNQHGLRTAQICRIWKSAWSAQASRLTCVLGAQAANTFTADEALRCPLALAAGLTATPCHQDIDAVAIAPYFGDYLGTEFDGNAAIVRDYTLDALFEELTVGRDELADFGGAVVTGGAVQQAIDRMQNYRTLVSTSPDYPGMRLVAYEGGQHLAEVDGDGSEDTQLTALFGAGNRDGRMGALYTDYLDAWAAEGPGRGEVMVLFNSTFRYGRFGNWGLLERIDLPPASEKHLAVRAFMDTTPCWWDGCNP